MFYLTMNLGKSVKKLASEFNVVFSFYKNAGIYKANSLKALGDVKSNGIFEIPKLASINDLKSANFYKPDEEKFNFIIKKDVPLQKRIGEPDKIIKIKIKLPVGNLTKIVDLPYSVEKEIQEPMTKIISKRASKAHRNSIREIKGKHIISIRRRKMRIHKRKKYYKKHRVELLKKRFDTKLKKERNFQMQLKEIIKKESFDPEQYLINTLKTVHWQRPVTKVRGILAPQWVIKDFLNKKEEEKMLQQRLEICINSRK